MAKATDDAGSPDWQSTSRYDYTDALSRRGWAWEFLRRNDAYQQTWAEASPMVAVEARSRHLTILTAAKDPPGMRRWGLIFQRHAALRRQQGRGSLASAGLPACPSPGGAAGRLSRQCRVGRPVGVPLPHHDAHPRRWIGAAYPVSRPGPHAPIGRRGCQRAWPGATANRCAAPTAGPDCPANSAGVV